MRQIVTVVTFIFTLSFVGVSMSESLTDLGWEKEVDDFEGTTTYSFGGKPFSLNCIGTVSAVFASLDGEPEDALFLTILIYGTGLEDAVRSGKLRFKSEAGIVDVDTQCEAGFSDGTYQLQCAAKVDRGLASEMAQTSFARLDTPSKNYDWKPDNSCKNMLKNLNKIGSDFAQS